MFVVSRLINFGRMYCSEVSYGKSEWSAYPERAMHFPSREVALRSIEARYSPIEINEVQETANV